MNDRRGFLKALAGALGVGSAVSVAPETVPPVRPRTSRVSRLLVLGDGNREIVGTPSTLSGHITVRGCRA